MDTVLSIEDDKAAINILRLFLERFGYKFYGATNAVAGLEIAGEVKPDVILMDLLMAEMNGWQAIERLRENSNVSHIPIIVLSALTDRDSQARALEVGADVYLTKPYRFYDLKSCIDEFLQSSVMASSGSEPSTIHS